MTFTPTTHSRIRKVHTFSEGAAGLSAKTVGQVSKYAQNIGATLAKRGAAKPKHGIGPDGKPLEDYKPGLLNKSMMAFSTIADGIDQAGRNLLAGTSTAATTVVSHKYGAEAGEISKSIGGGFKNVGLVYIDAAGVSRKAIVKSVAKGMVVGKMRGGGDLVVGGGDGGALTSQMSSSSGGSAGAIGAPSTQSSIIAPPGINAPSALKPTQPLLTSSQDRERERKPQAREDKEVLNWKEREAREGRYTPDDYSMSGGRETPEVVGFGRAAPPAYQTGPGENLEGQWAGDIKR